jgi:hypothetical protein
VREDVRGAIVMCEERGGARPLQEARARRGEVQAIRARPPDREPTTLGGSTG